MLYQKMMTIVLLTLSMLYLLGTQGLVFINKRMMAERNDSLSATQ